MVKRILFIAFCIWALGSGHAQQHRKNWKYIIVNGAPFSIPPPPDAKQIITELQQMQRMQQNIIGADEKNMHYWQAVPPSSRWQEIANLFFDDTAQYWARTQAYLNISIYDAMLAAVQTANSRPRKPLHALHKEIQVKRPVGQTSFYPCLHSAAAGAASTLLSHLFPAKKIHCNSLRSPQVSPAYRLACSTRPMWQQDWRWVRQ